MNKYLMYKPLTDKLLEGFGDNLKAAVLFGSRAKGNAREQSDHDIFLVIEELPENPIERQKQLRTLIWEIPLRINLIAKTPAEVNRNLTPLLLEVCTDGSCLYGSDYFQPYRKKVLEAVEQAGLKRKRYGREWYWQFDNIPKKEWELTWEGYRELS
jgi:predicted nucleotidyltransferase